MVVSTNPKETNLKVNSMTTTMKKNMNKIKTKYVIKKKIEGNKPEGLNISTILEAVETQREAQ